MFQGDRSKVPCNFISMMSAWRMLKRGCRGFLAYIRDMEREVTDLDEVPVVREFPDVFSRGAAWITPRYGGRVRY